MKKKITALLLLAVATLTLGACGDKEEAPKYGLVTNSAGIGTEGVNADIWMSIQEAAGSDYLYKSYTAEEDTDEGLDDQFDAAASDRTELVFAYGKDMETPVFRAQRSHHKTRYILVGGMPRKYEGDEVSFRENTTVVSFATQDAGFIAGYGAVRNGYRNIGFIAGSDEEINKRYLSGFVQGAEQAAAELNLTNGEVKMTAVYGEKDILTPLRMTDALILYNSGVEVIYAIGENVGISVSKAAQSVGKPFIAGGLDMNNVSASCIFSTITINKAAIDAALDDFDNGELPGGETVYYGAADKAVKIVADYTRLSTFTETDYNNAVRQIMEGTVQVSGDEVTEGTAHVALTISVPPSGMTEEMKAAYAATSSTAENTGDTGTESAAGEETADEETEDENTEDENTEDEETEYSEEEYEEEEYTEE